jgi:antibiotic biosynthesis monooxygenase (ABM) superfamily enzyme
MEELPMIGVLTHHWAKTDRVNEARELLDRNGLAQSKAPGFIKRITMISLADETKITTLVTWENNDIYEAWRASPERAAVMGDASRLWSQPSESERFEVVG